MVGLLFSLHVKRAKRRELGPQFVDVAGWRKVARHCDQRIISIIKSFALFCVHLRSQE